MEETIHNVLAIITLVINGLGVIVVGWGVLEAFAYFGRLKFSREKENSVSISEAIRQGLGAHLLLGLEIFIAADIISSVISPSWEKVGILAAIIGIRAVLSYFLKMELKQ